MRTRTLTTLATLTLFAAAARGEAPGLESAEVGSIPNLHVCGGVLLAGQPNASDRDALVARGIRRVITLRPATETNWDEQAWAEGAKLEFVRLPVSGPDSLTDEVFEQARKLLSDMERPTLLHCASANRVGAVWLAHRVLDHGVPLEKAVEEARSVGLRSPQLEAKARDYIRRQQ